MRKKKSKPETDREVDVFYYKLEQIIKERGTNWSKVSNLCGWNRRTLNSMKAQRINPSWSAVVKIAKALDVSLDELTETKDKSPELLEYYWAVPRLIPDMMIQGMVCKMALLVAYNTADSINGTKTEPILHRDTICKAEMKEKCKALKAKMKQTEESTDEEDIEDENV